MHYVNKNFMPQLDFFTFPHQYLVASICFCGLYYFNLLYFFTKIKFLYLSKIFSINGYFVNQIFVIGEYLIVLKDLVILQSATLFSFKKKNKKLYKKIFLKKINVPQVFNNLATLVFYFFFGFLFLFLFLKNFLIFNSEKLMLVYFLLISAGLFLFLNKYLESFLYEDLWKFLEILLLAEQDCEKILVFLRNFFLKIQSDLAVVQLEFLLHKNYEFKSLKRLKC